MWSNRYKWGIITVIVLFLLFNAFLIITSYSTDFHLVEDDYYQEEIEYQEKIDMLKRANNLSEKIDIVLNQSDHELMIHIPEQWLHSIQTGTIGLYRPSDAGDDRQYPLSGDEDGNQSISTAQMAKGSWKIGIEWEMDQVSYYMEKNIFLQ